LSQFFVPDVQSATRCEESCATVKSITVTGVDALDGKVKAYTGVVQSVEDHGESKPLSQRWRVTMRDA
jgi:hypothetical protein